MNVLVPNRALCTQMCCVPLQLPSNLHPILRDTVILASVNNTFSEAQIIQLRLALGEDTGRPFSAGRHS